MKTILALTLLFNIAYSSLLSPINNTELNMRYLNGMESDLLKICKRYDLLYNYNNGICYSEPKWYGKQWNKHEKQVEN